MFLLAVGVIALVATLRAGFNNRDYQHLLNEMAEQEAKLIKHSQNEIQHMLASTEHFKEKLKEEEALSSDIQRLKKSVRRKMIYRSLFE